MVLLIKTQKYIGIGTALHFWRRKRKVKITLQYINYTHKTYFEFNVWDLSVQSTKYFTVISGFRRGVGETFAVWHIARRRLVCYRRFGTPYRISSRIKQSSTFSSDCLTSEDGTERLSEMSATNYQPTPRNIPHWRPQGSLSLRPFKIFSLLVYRIGL